MCNDYFIISKCKLEPKSILEAEKLKLYTEGNYCTLGFSFLAEAFKQPTAKC